MFYFIYFLMRSIARMCKVIKRKYGDVGARAPGSWRIEDYNWREEFQSLEVVKRIGEWVGSAFFQFNRETVFIQSRRIELYQQSQV